MYRGLSSGTVQLTALLAAWQTETIKQLSARKAPGLDARAAGSSSTISCSWMDSPEQNTAARTASFAAAFSSLSCQDSEES